MIEWSGVGRRFSLASRLYQWFTAGLLCAISANSFAGKGVDYFYTDQQGTVLAVADVVGAVTERVDRIPYGAAIGADAAGNSSETSNGIVHYGANGMHIVPARPSHEP
ncbi:polymorphic toxin type 50 domain-containing protein [Luteibacter sp. UNC138MFCol5.1]|uniref:polymorphic toxin type 50 domain-containing protein n=1 Tax=Luteibacter sp. UNC138MFCol5.1 TaxID=1502774 RepID=UPI0011609683|nr:polymorphic toxin type 50 domain-containing protein [Luteibacter sp. UNC138MFCol5.1]